MKENNIKHGIVGLFDVLGFQDIANVEAEQDVLQVASLVREKIVRIPKKFEEVFSYESPLAMRSLGWCIFADSILVWREVPAGEPEVYWWHFFFRVSTGLMKLMFNEGLPLRAAISTGTFSVEDHCPVGKPIVECHRLAQRTVWSGCAVTPTAEKRLEALWQDDADWSAIMEQVCVRYEAPLKNENAPCCGQAQKRPSLALKWFHDDLWHAPDDIAVGIPTAVRESFEAHGKQICPDAQKKLENTIQFLKFVDGLYANSNSPRK